MDKLIILENHNLSRLSQSYWEDTEKTFFFGKNYLEFSMWEETFYMVGMEEKVRHSMHFGILKGDAYKMVCRVLCNFKKMLRYKVLYG